MAVSSPQLARQLYAGRAPYPLVIGGAEVSTGSSFAAIDPSTGSEWATLSLLHRQSGGWRRLRPRREPIAGRDWRKDRDPIRLTVRSHHAVDRAGILRRKVRRHR